MIQHAAPAVVLAAAGLMYLVRTRGGARATGAATPQPQRAPHWAAAGCASRAPMPLPLANPPARACSTANRRSAASGGGPRAPLAARVRRAPRPLLTMTPPARAAEGQRQRAHHRDPPDVRPGARAAPGRGPGGRAGGGGVARDGGCPAAAAGRMSRCRAAPPPRPPARPRSPGAPARGRAPDATRPARPPPPPPPPQGVLLFVAAAAAVLLARLLLARPAAPAVSLLDFSVYRPPESWRLTRPDFVKMTEKGGMFAPEDIDFQARGGGGWGRWGAGGMRGGGRVGSAGVPRAGGPSTHSGPRPLRRPASRPPPPRAHRPPPPRTPGQGRQPLGPRRRDGRHPGDRQLRHRPRRRALRVRDDLLCRGRRPA
jgi:hypothetical protein